MKTAIFISSARDDLRAFPPEVRRVMGLAIKDAQEGREHLHAKALKGFGGRGVLEIVDDFDRNTFRAVYTVRYTEVVYVLHAFQKKSKSGIATRKHDIELIRRRLQTAAAHHAANFSEG